MKKIYFLPILLVFTILASCSEYSKVIKEDDYVRKFEMANDLYENEPTNASRNKAIGLYEQIYQRLPKQGEGELAYFRIGKAYYENSDFYMAGYYLGVFPQRFPYSPKAEEALFLSAMCSVHNSPEFSLDQLETEVAINNLQQFANRYPNSPLVDSCNNIIDGLHFKLETKSYEAVMLYAKTENFRATVSSALVFAEDYPMSVFREDVQFTLVKNSYFLAKNSIDAKKIERTQEAIERYSTFVAAFPESTHIDVLAERNDEMIEYLADLKRLGK